MTKNNDDWLNDDDLCIKSSDSENNETNVDETNVDETNVDSDDDSDDYSSCDEDGYNPVFPCLKLNTSNFIYSVTKDGESLFYVKTLDNAREIMWSCARKYRMRWFVDHNTFIREGSDRNIISITGYYRYYLLSYERLFSTFAIKKIYELSS